MSYILHSRLQGMIQGAARSLQVHERSKRVFTVRYTRLGNCEAVFRAPLLRAEARIGSFGRDRLLV
jgi:hypothetical protein